MKSWGDWEVTRHKVAICGHVLRQNGKPCAQAKVTVNRAYKQVKPKGKAGTEADKFPRNPHSCPKTTLTRHDGLFFFLDLPEGEYTVRAEGPRAGEYGQNLGKVARDKEGNIRIAVADIELSL